MAKINFGVNVADARGAVDGVVFSKNRSGAYLRTKVSPVQPQSNRQTIVRDRLVTLSKDWATVLTDAERAAWSAFGRINPVVDIWGNSNTLSGINAYVKRNGIILNAGGAKISTPPASLAALGLATVSAAAAAGAGTLAITYTATPLAADEKLYIYATQGLTAGRSFFKPYMRFIGSSAAAQASPFAAGTIYVAKFGAMIADSALGLMVSVVNTTTGALTPGVFVRVIVAA